MRSVYDDPLPLLTDTDLAYMAGLIDGEGYVGVSSVGPDAKRQYRSDLRLEMTDHLAMEWVGETFGGPVGERHPKGISKPTRYWSACGKRAAEILHDCLPYLKTKHAHALVAIVYAQTLKYRGRRGVPDVVRAQRNELVEISKGLNRKGVHAAVPQD